MRVLIVEDDSATARQIEIVLSKEGFICDTTDLGEDGLEIGKSLIQKSIIYNNVLPAAA